MATRSARLRETLSKIYKEDATTDAVVAMYNAIDSTTAVLEGDLSDENKIGVAQALFDMSTGLATNAFMAAYGARIMPVFQTAVNAYLDHLNYFEQDQKTYADMSNPEVIENRSRLLTCAYVKHEIALTALLCEQGAGALRAKSRELRDQLIDLEKPE